MPIFQYRFAHQTLARLSANGVAWQAALWVLGVAHPVVREVIGVSLLRVTGADDRGHLLMVVLQERADEDDAYDILSARYLDDEEAADARRLLTMREER